MLPYGGPQALPMPSIFADRVEEMAARAPDYHTVVIEGEWHSVNRVVVWLYTVCFPSSTPTD